MRLHTLVFIFLAILTAPAFAQNELYQKVFSNNIDTGINAASRYLESHSQEEFPHENVAVACRLAKLYTSQYQFTKANKVLNQLSDLINSDGFDKPRIQVMLAQANILKYQKKYPEALAKYHDAIRLSEAIEAWQLLLVSQIDIAEYYRSIAQFAKAEEYINASFITIDKYASSDTSVIIRAYSRAAAIANETNNHSASISYSRKALQLAQVTNNTFNEGVALNELGFTYKNSNRIDSAIGLYKAAEKVFFQMGARAEAVHAMNNRAMLYAHEIYPKPIIFNLYKQIIDTVSKYELDYPLIEVYHYLQLEHAALGDTNTAYRWAQRYYADLVYTEKLQYDREVANITEEFENEQVRREKTRIESDLAVSQETLERKQFETRIIYISLAVAGVLVLIIAFLAIKLSRSNKQLLERNKEKDVLIQEIHHRVKNNLQIIQSLLELQTKKTEDPSAKSIMTEGQNRVRSMALIHKKLYQNDNLQEISFESYLEDLFSALFQIYHSNDKTLDFKVSAGDLVFDIDTAVPLGLIVNELVTNSFKYAVPYTDNPFIYIIVKALGRGEYGLEVQDNGPGLPESFNINETTSLGLRLVQRLSKQLSGSFSYENGEMNRFRVTFKDTVTRKSIE